jgi:hypothetical protein
MSILSALSENRHDKKNLAELAKLPQALIMQMGQRKELSQEEVAMVISKKAEAIESAARQKALEQGGGQMPSVIEQDMMKIAQAENPAPPQQMQQQMMPQQMAQGPEDVGIAQNPVPPMQMAGGGIIAFDEGGDVDVDPEDDYQDLIDQANEDATNDEIFGIIAAMEGSREGSAGVGIRSGENKNITQDTRERGGDMVDRLRAQILQKESGGKRYDKNGNLLTSSKGALGEMQVMPATARDPGFGIKAARDNSPEELRRVGDEYASVLLNRYRDPKLAMIAYNMGPGATDKWLASGADIRKLPKETQGYIRGVNLAEGGEVKRYAAGDFVDDTQYDPISGLPISGYETYRERPSEREMPSEYFMDLPLQRKAAKEQNKKIGTTKAAAPARGKASPTEVEQFFSRFDTIPTTTKPVDNAGAQETTPKEKEFNLMEYIRERQARTDKASENDKNIALLSAGLGILGGTSPYAFENIGKGAQMGVQQLGQLQKLRASQDIAGDKILGSAYNAEMLNKIRRDQLAQGKEQRSDKLAQDLQIAKANEIGKRLKLKGITDEMIGMLEQKEMLKTIKPDELAKLNLFKQQMKKVEDDVSRLFPSTGTNSNYRLVGVR